MDRTGSPAYSLFAGRANGAALPPLAMLGYEGTVQMFNVFGFAVTENS